jgi:hypothetical protein
MKLTGKRCQCGGCREYFSRVTVFDRHRIGKVADRHCVHWSKLSAIGLRLVDGVWKWPPKQQPREFQTTSPQTNTKVAGKVLRA